MFLHELAELVPPPEHPEGTVCSDEEVAEMQEAFGIRLPTDYIALARMYGTGYFELPNVRFTVHNCVEPKFWAHLPTYLDVVRRLFEESEIVRNVAPDRPGLFPWGDDDVGNYFLLAMTDLSPESWSVAISPRNPFPDDGGQDIFYRECPMNVSKFVLEFVKGRNPERIYSLPPTALVGPVQFVSQPYPEN